MLKKSPSDKTNKTKQKMSSLFFREFQLITVLLFFAILKRTEAQGSFISLKTVCRFSIFDSVVFIKVYIFVQ